MAKWIRPSGSEIETADGPDMEAFAAKSGWKKAQKAKRVRRTKEQIAADELEKAND